MPSPTALREIIERPEKLTGGDREVDADIYESLGYTVKRASERITKQYRVTFTKSWAFQGPNTRRWLAMDRLTDSLDAAIALVEKMLPGWVVAGLSNGTLDPKYRDVRLYTGWRANLGRVGAEITPETVGGQDFATGTAPTPAIALLLALFRALEQKP